MQHKSHKTWSSFTLCRESPAQEMLRKSLSFFSFFLLCLLLPQLGPSWSSSPAQTSHVQGFCIPGHLCAAGRCEGWRSPHSSHPSTHNRGRKSPAQLETGQASQGATGQPTPQHQGSQALGSAPSSRTPKPPGPSPICSGRGQLARARVRASPYLFLDVGGAVAVLALLVEAAHGGGGGAERARPAPRDRLCAETARDEEVAFSAPLFRPLSLARSVLASPPGARGPCGCGARCGAGSSVRGAGRSGGRVAICKRAGVTWRWPGGRGRCQPAAAAGPERSPAPSRPAHQRHLRGEEKSSSSPSPRAGSRGVGPARPLALHHSLPEQPAANPGRQLPPRSRPRAFFFRKKTLETSMNFLKGPGSFAAIRAPGRWDARPAPAAAELALQAGSDPAPLGPAQPSRRRAGRPPGWHRRDEGGARGGLGTRRLRPPGRASPARTYTHTHTHPSTHPPPHALTYLHTHTPAPSPQPPRQMQDTVCCS